MRQLAPLVAFSSKAFPEVVWAPAGRKKWRFPPFYFSETLVSRAVHQSLPSDLVSGQQCQPLQTNIHVCGDEGAWEAGQLGRGTIKSLSRDAKDLIGLSSSPAPVSSPTLPRSKNQIFLPKLPRPSPSQISLSPPNPSMSMSTSNRIDRRQLNLRSVVCNKAVHAAAAPRLSCSCFIKPTCQPRL